MRLIYFVRVSVYEKKRNERVFIFFVTKALLRCLLDDPAPSVSGAGEFFFTVSPMMHDVCISWIAVDFRE